jgi:hypothetical protein
MRQALLLIALLCPGVAAAFEAPEAPEGGAAAFAKLQGLAGEWEGTFEWTGRSGKGAVAATYYLTGNGSAVVENLAMNGVLAMTSVYHLDGPDLRLTHYCAAQNQPRLRAHRIDVAKGIMDFAFVDATNLRSPDAGHVQGLEIRLLDDDHLTLAFVFEGGGGRSREQIAMKRAHPKRSGEGP